MHFASLSLSGIFLFRPVCLNTKYPSFLSQKSPIPWQCNVSISISVHNLLNIVNWNWRELHKGYFILQNLDRKKNWIKYLIIGDGGRRLSLYGARKVFRNNSVCFFHIYINLNHQRFKSPPALSRRFMKLNLSFQDFSLHFFVLWEIYVAAIISKMLVFLANFGF